VGTTTNPAAVLTRASNVLPQVDLLLYGLPAMVDESIHNPGNREDATDNRAHARQEMQE
jgi:hypothetical protein